MKRYLLAAIAAVIIPVAAQAQLKVNVTVDTEVTDGQIIPKEIYGQFAEHLGSCIYGGLWVGPESEIPNVDGYRKDVLDALIELKVPVMRWPGGCFADEYHWNPAATRAKPKPLLLCDTGSLVDRGAFAI